MFSLQPSLHCPFCSSSLHQLQSSRVGKGVKDEFEPGPKRTRDLVCSALVMYVEGIWTNVVLVETGVDGELSSVEVGLWLVKAVREQMIWTRFSSCYLMYLLRQCCAAQIDD